MYMKSYLDSWESTGNIWQKAQRVVKSFKRKKLRTTPLSVHKKPTLLLEALKKYARFSRKEMHGFNPKKRTLLKSEPFVFFFQIYQI